MEESDVIRLVRSVIHQELTHVYMGKVQSTDNNRAVLKRFPTDANLPNLRNIQPYGFASRPKAQMDSLIIPVGADATHLNMVGQFDTGRPTVQNEGETCLYGPDGKVVYMKSDSTIRIGSPNALAPAVLGDILKNFLTDFINAFLNNPIGECALGDVVLSPALRVLFEQYKTDYVNTASTNILSQETFLERGP